METNTNQEPLSFENRIDIQPILTKLEKVKSELAQVIVGQKKMIDLLLVSMLADGHVLIEGVPGIAKTLTAKSLAKTLALDFKRIQFTPDLMPSDILGTSIFDLKKNEFEFKRGPIFANMVLIDEINRAPAKTQAALFEVMEERQITIDGKEFIMDKPFLVVATQNPIEQEGTYRLPEAQLDRFLFKIQIDYPNANEELELLKREHLLKNQDKTSLVHMEISKTDLGNFQQITKQIVVEEHLIQYIANIVLQTRENPFLYMGASPRASIALLNASKGLAILRGRDFVTPEDIKEIAIPVLNHRVILSPEREMEGMTTNEVITQIVESIEIPR
jgi:MoxR-like ATPase